MLKLKLQYFGTWLFGSLMWRTDSLKKTLMLGGIGGIRRRGRQKMRWLMASPTRWTWVWVNFGSRWWIGRPGVLWFMGLQSRTRLNDWAELRGPGGGEEPQIPFLPSLTPSGKKFKNKQKLLSCPSPCPGRTFLGQSLGHCVTHIFLCVRVGMSLFEAQMCW